MHPLSGDLLSLRPSPPNPHDPTARSFVWGVGELLSQGKPREALGLCRAGVEAHPHFVSGWLMMARVLAALGEVPGALEWLDALLNLSPTHRGALTLKSSLAPPPEAVRPQADPPRPSAPLEDHRGRPAPGLFQGKAALSSPQLGEIEEPRALSPAPTSPALDAGAMRPPEASLGDLPGARDLKALLGGMGDLWEELGGGAHRGRSEATTVPPPAIEEVEEEEVEEIDPLGPSSPGLLSETLANLYLAQGDEASARDIFTRLAKARGATPKPPGRREPQPQPGLPLKPKPRSRPKRAALAGLPFLESERRAIDALLAWSHHFDAKEAH